MKAVHVLFLALLMACLGASGVQARVDITPQRVVLEPRERNGEFVMLNILDEPSTIRISILNYRQNDDGVYTELDAPLNPAFDPDSIVRLSPRQFTLSPHGRQLIRFSLRRPADLPDGEYRFHIMAMRLAKQGPPVPADGAGTSVRTSTNVGVSIPVIVRHGHVSATASLSDPELVSAGIDQTTGGEPTIRVTVNRQGNASVLGTLRAYWYPQGGQPVEIGMAGNVNVFTDVDRRRASIPLNKTPQGPGSVRIVYTNDEDNNAAFAEISLPL